MSLLERSIMGYCSVHQSSIASEDDVVVDNCEGLNHMKGIMLLIVAMAERLRVTNNNFDGAMSQTA